MERGGMERDVNVGIEAKYQAVILACSKERKEGADADGDNSNQLLCFCPNELPRKKTQR